MAEESKVMEPTRLLRIEEGDIFVVFVPERHIQEVDKFEGITKRLREGLKQLTGRDVPVLVLPDTFRVGIQESDLTDDQIHRVIQDAAGYDQNGDWTPCVPSRFREALAHVRTRVVEEGPF